MKSEIRKTVICASCGKVYQDIICPACGSVVSYPVDKK